MRVALYGVGRMGAHHARHLVALGAELRLVDPEKGHADRLDGIDAVVVAAPTRLHRALAEPWLVRGVPVLVEKPLAPTLADAEALAAHAHCSVGHVERFNPAFAALAGVDARFVQAERLAAWSDRGFDADVVLDLMIHDLDLFWALTRSPVREVRANGLSVRSGMVDIVHARVETEGGHVGVFAASRISRKAVRSLRVFGPDGYWSADLRDRAVLRVSSGLEESVVPVAAYDALGAELQAFLGAVGGGPAFPVSAAEALPSLRAAEAIRCACS